ncbi:MAG: mRNA surveillance protein pelota [Candidatus Heimdallarchaeota archaeon]|nr:MAG: mRNA surveillance protein pelota [Candidatus Heimdallarchaeota archaeon]
MRILKTDMKNRRVVVRPETPTDLYILSNVINIGDQIITKTSRRVRRSGSEGRSGDESQRITMVIGVVTEDFAFQDSSVSNRLRVKGKIFQGPEQHVSLGSYHTLNLELTRTITIIKPEWSKYFLELLKKAEEASKKPKICLIAADKAEVCIGILDNFNLNVIAHEKSHISRKLTKEKVRSKQTQSFFDRIAMVINRQVLPETNNIVLGGPGFIKEQLTNFLKRKFVKEKLNIIVSGSLSGGNRVGLSELLQMDAVDKLAADFQVFEENSLIDEFFKRINQGTTNVTYGFAEIRKIASTGAIETLILLDALLRGGEGINPDEIQHLLREVEKTRGKIFIVSSQSENANRMKTFGGIIGLLRYALHWE